MLSPDQISRYLNRIAYYGPTHPDCNVLRDIQWAHLQAVPFEALDICPLDRPFSIDPEHIYDKVVLQRRGGFCFELNGLLAVLLESFGYAVTRCAASFTDAPDEDHDPFDHLALEITVPGDGSRWYCDVAAGRQNPNQPVPIDGETEDGRFRTRMINDLRHFEKRDETGSWVPQLAWSPIPRMLSDFEERSRYLQLDPSSDFRKGPLCTLMIPDGRLTLSKWTLITTIGTERTEQLLKTHVGIQATLAEWFGIDLAFDHWWEEEA